MMEAIIRLHLLRLSSVRIVVFNEMKVGFEEVTEEIHLLRDDFRELFMREVNELRGEIYALKETVARIEKAMAAGKSYP